MKRLNFLGLILGTLVALLMACLVVVITLVWLIRSWYPAPWAVGALGIGLLAGAIALIWRWWRLPAERRFRFNLRGMLIGITLFALWFGVVGVDVLRWGREAAVIRELAGRGVTVNHYLSADQDWIRTRQLLDRVFGYNPFLKVQDIDIRHDQGLPALLEHGDDFPDLEIVNFCGGGISDAGLERVGELNRFPKLRTGMLYGCTVTDSGLERLTVWTRLEEFYLDNCGKVTDAGLASLHELPSLRVLGLGAGSMPITDAGMAHVAGLRQLRELRIVSVPISDAGIAQLRDMPNLERVHLGRTNETENGIQALHRALPDCFVTWERAFFPVADQVQRIDIWSTAPEESLLTTVTEQDRIVSIMAWLEENHARLWESSSWHRSTEEYGPSAACLSVRFEGRSRRLCEMRLGNGIYETIWGGYCEMQSADEEEIRGLLGVDESDWPREID